MASEGFLMSVTVLSAASPFRRLPVTWWRITATRFTIRLKTLPAKTAGPWPCIFTLSGRAVSVRRNGCCGGRAEAGGNAISIGMREILPNSDSMNLRRCSVCRSILLLAGLLLPMMSVAEDPAELTAARQKFLAQQKAISDERPISLNESYLKRVRAMSQDAQKNGETSVVEALTREIQSIEKHGCPAAEVSADVTEKFARMRKLYSIEYERFHRERLERHTSLVKQYQGQLDALIVSLTKAGRIEDAVSVQAELKSAGNMTLPSDTSAVGRQFRRRASCSDARAASSGGECHRRRLVALGRGRDSPGGISGLR